jgi:hypothetical protein
MTDLTPALTAEEWERRWCVRVDTTVSINKYGLVVINDGSNESSGRAEIGADAGYAAIALLNHVLPDGDPRKLTWADVEAAREMGDADMDAADSMDTSPRHAPVLWRLAAKIAALLPSPGDPCT